MPRPLLTSSVHVNLNITYLGLVESMMQLVCANMLQSLLWKILKKKKVRQDMSCFQNIRCSL